ncbi:MAG: ParB/RepB/Spo0J family partition protein, partial [Chloroflexi bacterium]|nr:ParB/RepB/Spo0J family partition protein [Chloroflexota bacterium]
TYLLQAGERRLRAARMVGLKEIPSIIRPSLNGSGPRERLMLALVENLQRADMSPIDEANGYAVLKNEHGLSQIEIAHQVGVPCSRVSRMMNLLKLEKQTQKLIQEGTLSNDPRVVDSLLDLEKSDQVKVASVLAARRAGPKAALEAIARYQEHLRGEKFGAEVIPAQRIAFSKAGQPNKTQWDALQQVGRIPPWLLVEITARDVCEMCNLRYQASVTTCRTCALVEMLVGLIGKANHGGH